MRLLPQMLGVEAQIRRAEGRSLPILPIIVISPRAS